MGDRALLDADPDAFVGGTLALRPEEFKAATLTTFDGNDYFIVVVHLAALTVVIQDDASGVW